MLQLIHEKVKGVVSTVIIALIVGAFLAVGLNEYARNRGPSSTAAVVGGKKLTWQTVGILAERMAKERGELSDPRLLAEARSSLVQQGALYQGFYQQGLRVSDQQIAKILASIPHFQDDNGKFSKEKYLKLVHQFGYQDLQFRQDLMQNLLLNQAQQGVLASALSFPYELTQALILLEETRDFSYVILPKAKFLKKIKSTLADWENYFQSYAARYVIPEQVSVDYVELSLDQLTQNIPVSDAELENFYLENQGFYNTPEMRQVRQIFLPKKQKSRAEKILAELEASNHFSDLAKTWSEDEATAEKGGDMGWITRGELDSNLEEAIWSLKKPNDISGILESGDGYHIFQLVAEKLPTTQPFKEAKPLVMAHYQQQKANQLFEEKKEQLATLAFENPESLDNIHRVMGLNIYETALFDRQGQGAEKWTEYPDFLDTAFGPMVLQEKKNSGLIRLSDEKVLVMHLKKHEMAHQASFGSVKERVQRDYEQQAVQTLLAQTAQTISESLSREEDLKSILKAQGLVWQTENGIDRRESKLNPALVTKLFELPSDKLGNKPFPQTVALPNGDYAVLSLMRVHPGDPDKVNKKTQETYQQQLSDSLAQLEFALWAKQTLQNVKVQWKPIPKEWLAED